MVSVGYINCVRKDAELESRRKKEGALTLCDSIDGTGERYAK